MIEFWKSNYFSMILCLLLTACGGGSGGGGSDAVPVPLKQPVKEELITVSISSSQVIYEVNEDTTIELKLLFSEETRTATHEKWVVQNAEIISSRYVLGSAETTYFLKPDGSGLDLTIQVPAGITTSRDRQKKSKASNIIVVRAVDSISPKAEFEYKQLSYGNHQGVGQIELTVNITERVIGFDQNAFEFTGLEIIDFSKLNDLVYNVTLRSVQTEPVLRVTLPAGILVDAFGNKSQSAEILNIDGSPLLPKGAVSQFEASSPNFQSIEFSWTAIENTDYYQLAVDRQGGQGVQVLSDRIEPSNLRAELTGLKLIEATNHKFQINACNLQGCIQGQGRYIPGALRGAIGYLNAPKAHAIQAFGIDVALSDDGDVMAVGASNNGVIGDDPLGEQSDSFFSAGAVYIYQKQGGIWEYKAFLQAPNRGVRHYFGRDISLSGDGKVLAVGAWNENGQKNNPDASGTPSGAVYIYRNIDDEWQFEKYLKLSSITGNDQFGNDLSLDQDGNTLAVAASYRRTSIGRTGAVHLIKYDNGEWEFTQELVPAMGNDQALFGNELVINSQGTRLVVGMPGLTVAGNVNVGASITYKKLASGLWEQEQFIAAPSNQANQYFGSALDMNYDSSRIAIGAKYLNHGSVKSTGAVYLYHLVSNIYEQKIKLEPKNSTTYTDFGFSVALSGDGAQLMVASKEFSRWEAGFYVEESPNDHWPFSFSASHHYTFTNNTWTLQSFLKSGFDCQKPVMDRTGDNTVCGGYDNEYLVNGFKTPAEIKVLAPEKKSLVGGVLIY